MKSKKCYTQQMTRKKASKNNKRKTISVFCEGVKNGIYWCGYREIGLKEYSKLLKS